MNAPTLLEVFQLIDTEQSCIDYLLAREVLEEPQVCAECGEMSGFAWKLDCTYQTITSICGGNAQRGL
jgi:hypothetical protein